MTPETEFGIFYGVLLVVFVALDIFEFVKKEKIVWVFATSAGFAIQYLVLVTVWEFDEDGRDKAIYWGLGTFFGSTALFYGAWECKGKPNAEKLLFSVDFVLIFAVVIALLRDSVQGWVKLTIAYSVAIAITAALMLLFCMIGCLKTVVSEIFYIFHECFAPAFSMMLCAFVLMDPGQTLDDWFSPKMTNLWPFFTAVASYAFVRWILYRFFCRGTGFEKKKMGEKEHNPLAYQYKSSVRSPRRKPRYTKSSTYDYEPGDDDGLIAKVLDDEL